VLGDLVHLPVAHDQPGGQVAVEQHRHHRAVPPAHLGVERGGVLLEQGPVERDPLLGGRGVSGHDAASRAAVCVCRWVTRAIRTSLAEARSRASQSITGTSGPSESASRTSSWVCSGSSNRLSATMNGTPLCSSRSMAYQESSMRRVSTSTTAPSVPENSRSHRNQNRSWPGAPKR